MFHRLRVLNFSKSFLSDDTNRIKPKKQIRERNAKIPERKASIKIKNSNEIKDTICCKEVRKQPCVTYNDVKEDSSESDSSPMFQRNLTSHKKSLSEPLTCPSKKYNLKNLSQRRTFSLFDVKKRTLGKRHQYYKNIKLAFQLFKKDTTIKRSRRKIKREPEDTNFVCVCSSKEPIQSTATRNVSSNNNLISRIRRKRSDASTSYSEMFGFCNKKRVFDPISLYQRGINSDNIFRKMKRRSTTKRKNINEHSRMCSRPQQQFKVVSSELEDGSTNYSNRLHYNLVDFSRCSCKINKKRSQESARLYLQEGKNDANVICSRCCKASSPERKNASTSCIKLEASCTDAACATNKSVVLHRTPSPVSSVCCSRKTHQINIPKCIICKKCLKKTVSFKQIKPMSNEISCKKTSAIRKFQMLSKRSPHKRDIQGKTVLKFVVLAIVAVAWSPCVLAIACGWLLTYPLRPKQEVSENNKSRCQEKCFTHYNNNNHGFWALIVGNMKNAFHKTVSTGIAIKSLLVSDRVHKAKSEQINSSPTLINSGATELPKHPNPQKRYTLCYNVERGWVMKPVRQRKRNRTRFGVFSKALQNILCGYSCTSNAVRQDTAYNVTVETKLSDKSIKSSSTQKLPVKSKSKHFELQNKSRSCRKCCRHHHKTYTDKKTGGESMSCNEPTKITTGTETELSSIELTIRSPSGCSKVSDQRRPNTRKVNQRRKSSTEEKRQYQPSTQITSSICKKCSKLHSEQSPQSLKNLSSRVCQRYRDTNVLLSRRCQRRRTPGNSGSIALVPKRSVSAISIHHSDPQLAHRIPKRSRSESSKEPNSHCKSPPSRSCRIYSKGNLNSGHLEQSAYESGKPEEKRSSILSRVHKGHLERGAYESDKPEKKRSSILSKVYTGHLERDADLSSKSEEKRSKILSKKLSLKNVPKRSPADEHIDIKVRRKKKKKKKPKPEDKPRQAKNKKKTTFMKPVIFIQKLMPATKKKKSEWGKRVAQYCGGTWFNRCDKQIRDSIWPMNLNCRHLYLYTMRERPCFWVYRRCPSGYPKFLKFYYCFRCCFQSCMICLSLLFWTPIILGVYACYLACCQVCCNR